MTWKKIAEVEYETVDSQEGEAEAEYVNKRHYSEEAKRKDKRQRARKNLKALRIHLRTV